jgi:hypothetical protein
VKFLFARIPAQNLSEDGGQFLIDVQDARISSWDTVTRS